MHMDSELISDLKEIGVLVTTLFFSGEDGPSQMALEDLAMFRAIPTCTVFYPSDGVSTERAVELAANTKVRYMGLPISYTV